MANGEPVPGSLYFYAPVKWAPISFSIWFMIAALYHLYQCIKYKAFKITGLHPFCALLFSVGFALRAYDAWNFDNINTYIASTILIYCAPPILELANYHVLGRILYYVPYFSPLHPGRTLTTFGFVSALVEVMNALGVSYLANPNVDKKYVDLGHGLMKASLIVQIVVIAVFCLVSAIFHRRCTRAGITTRKVQAPLFTLYASMTLILTRTIYRIVEHFGQSRVPYNPPPGWDPKSLSPIVRYEWFFYVFEATLMLLNTVLWNVSHPRHYLPEDYHVYLAQDGITELTGPGWKDDVPWWITFIDPFGLTAAVISRSKKRENPERPFWETNGFEHVRLARKAGAEGQAV